MPKTYFQIKRRNAEHFDVAIFDGHGTIAASTTTTLASAQALAERFSFTGTLTWQKHTRSSWSATQTR